ncbi:MAG: late competence development ComFB family protein [Candidatus Fimivivens sp.]
MYRNVMENYVEEKVDRLLKNHAGCSCARCREDVIALALNNLPPKYVVSDTGALFVKVTQVDNISEVEITKQVAAAMKVVDESPHHDK